MNNLKKGQQNTCSNSKQRNNNVDLVRRLYPTSKSEMVNIYEKLNESVSISRIIRNFESVTISRDLEKLR